jgi:arylsulfatase A-like enzyme
VRSGRRSTLRFALVLAAAAVACSRAQRPPNVFLVTIDTLRVDHLSSRGYPRATSPHLDAFAATAVRFPDAVTPIPKTGPSITSLLSGTHPSETGVDENPAGIPDSLVLLAERLGRAGYHTGAFVSNPVLTAEKGYARGFEKYVLAPEPDGVERVTRAFAAWADGLTDDRPVFAWIHYMDPHGPYTPPAPYTDRFVDDELARGETRRLPITYRPLDGFPSAYVLGAIPDYQRIGDEDRVARYVAAYDAEILYTDAAFGTLLDGLRARGWLDASAIVVTADHGEAMGAHDYWFEHGWFAFDDVLRVPLFVRAPGAAGRDVAGSVSTLDVAPTVLGLARIAADPPLAGRDLLAAAPAPDASIVVMNASTYPDRFLGLRSPQWKYVRRLQLLGTRVARRADEELYDLRADPTEQNDLAAARPEKVVELRAELDRRLAAFGPRAKPRVVQMSPEIRARLRALGYTE